MVQGVNQWPDDDAWEHFYNLTRNSNAWNAFTADSGTKVPQIRETGSQQSFLQARRKLVGVAEYFQLAFEVAKVHNSWTWPDEMYDALDDIRVSIWRQYNSSGKPWKGILNPDSTYSSTEDRMDMQYWTFGIWARDYLRRNALPPTPPNEFSANEHLALKAFAGGLEATQEFVPDSWISPDNQMETTENLQSEDKSWKKSKTWRRSLGGIATVSRKALRTVLQRR